MLGHDVRPPPAAPGPRGVLASPSRGLSRDVGVEGGGCTHRACGELMSLGLIGAKANAGPS